MITFCSLCRIVYNVHGDLDEMKVLLRREEWRHSYPCITPLCSGRLTEISAGRLAHILPMMKTNKHIPLHGFYRAINGFGMADGDPAPVDLVKKLFLTKKIVDVHATEIGQPERTILKRLVLEDGTRLHFSRSTKGACLYYVEQPGPTCVEVLDGELADDDPQPDAVCAEVGEEAGRGDETDEDGQAGDTDPGAEVPRADMPTVQPAEELLPDPGD